MRLYYQTTGVVCVGFLSPSPKIVPNMSAYRMECVSSSDRCMRRLPSRSHLSKDLQDEPLIRVLGNRPMLG